MTENTKKTAGEPSTLGKSKEGTGLDKNTASALTYVLGPITGIVFLVIEKDPKVRFHAMQSLVVFGGLMLLQMMLGATIFLAILIPIVLVAEFVLWLLLIYKAWQGEDWEVPVLGQYARKFLKKA